jgi:phage baseplate assembly protein W
MSTLKTPFSFTPNGTVATETDPRKKVEQRIIDTLVTTQGERLMRPLYGASATSLLFEPVDDLLYGEFRIDALDELTRQVSGVSIEDLSISPANSYETDMYETSLNISVRYKIGPFDRGSVSLYLGDPNTLTQESAL